MHIPRDLQKADLATSAEISCRLDRCGEYEEQDASKTTATIDLELHKGGHGKSHTKGELKGDIVLECRAQVNGGDIALQTIVRQDIDAMVSSPLESHQSGPKGDHR